jgi:FAD:protein FMN transferase
MTLPKTFPTTGRWTAVALVLLPCVARAVPDTQVHYVMGTYLRITADGAGAAAGMQACFQEVRRLDDVFSRWTTISELSRLNAAAPGERAVSADMAELLRRSLALSDATGGAFDVAVGPLTALWRRPEPPRADEIAVARADATRDAVRIRGDRVTLASGARLDFDGIAKGFAVDACVARLRAVGVERALVSLGESSLYAIGAPAGDAYWRFAVRGADPETTVGTLGLRDIGASVSATFGIDGKAARRVAHIIDPRSCRPLEDDAVAVVASPFATDAEAFTKAVLVWGHDGVQRARARGAAAAIRVTPGAIQADVGAPVVWKPLPAPRTLAAREEPLR